MKLSSTVAVRKALLHLAKGGARGLPLEYSVLQARRGSAWDGRKRDGGYWRLIKHGEDNYNATF